MAKKPTAIASPSPDDDKPIHPIEDMSNKIGGWSQGQVDKYHGDSKLSDELGIVPHKSKAHRIENYSNLLPGISGRPGMNRQDYDYFRPEEATPVLQREIILASDLAYTRVGLIKNVIDLMSDFASQGVRISHPNRKIERFFRNWWTKVKMSEICERFLNYLYRLGNVPLKIDYAKINKKMEKDLYRTRGAKNFLVEEQSIENREIPLKYTFIHPCAIQVVGNQLASFVGLPRYALNLPAQLRQMIIRPKQEEQFLVDKLPADIIAAAKDNKPYVLPPESIKVFFYKKNDWDTWAYPLISGILDDITLLEKLKLSDFAALDGAISNIRIFKLGSLEHKIAPSPSQAAKLASALENNTSVGTIDLIWGPDIDMIESKTAVHQFLGDTKYTPTLNNIYAGLGIPPTLTGTYGAAGTTNNFISLKTLTQRLEYGRQILVNFLQGEIAVVQKAMGFRLPAQVEFDVVNLSDEDVEKKLLIELSDRNLISDELLRIRFKNNPDMERVRIKRENKLREIDQLPPKTGPYINGNFEIEYKKILLQNGLLSPSEVGLELEEKTDKSFLERQTELQPPAPKGVPTTKKKAAGPNGRPKTSKDSTKRKTKKFSPRSGAMLLWAKSAQMKIAEEINKLYLQMIGKANLRQLSTEEAKSLEDIKFGVLFAVEPFSDLNKINIEFIHSALQKSKSLVPMENYVLNINKIVSVINRPLTFEEIREVQALIFVTHHTASSTSNDSL
jgi:hypothetical protein